MYNSTPEITTRASSFDMIVYHSKRVVLLLQGEDVVEERLLVDRPTQARDAVWPSASNADPVRHTVYSIQNV